MDIWDWFSDNEKLLSGLAAALVIIGAFATVGRNFCSSRTHRIQNIHSMKCSTIC